jgi:CHAT domain-containing protein
MPTRFWLPTALLLTAALQAGLTAQPADTKQQLAKARALGKSAIEDFDRDDLGGALRLVEAKLKLEQGCGADGQPAVLESLTMLAEIYEEAAHPDKRNLGDRDTCLAQAHKFRQQALDLAAELYPKRWQATDARIALEYSKQLAKLSSKDVRDLLNLRYEDNKVLGKCADRMSAVQLCEVSSLCRIQGGGAGHSKATAGSLPYNVQGAEAIVRYVLGVRQKLLGPDHPYCAASWNNLGSLCYARGALDEAIKDFAQAEMIQRKALGANHPQLATTQGNLALVYQIKGDFAAALRNFREALVVATDATGKDSPLTAAALNNLAGACVAVGDWREAEALYQQALAIYRKDLAAHGLRAAVCLNNFASMYEIQGDNAAAAKYLQQAVDLLAQQKLTATLEYATALGNLAMLYQARHDYARAAPLHTESLAILGKLPSAPWAEIALTKNNLALLKEAQGQLDAAEKLLLEALQIRKERLMQKDHPGVAVSLTNLAGVYEARGQAAKAEENYREALRISRKNLELTALGQSERQQLATLAYLRKQLDAYLSLHLREKLDLQKAYEQVLPWKGAVFARQQFVRLHQNLGKRSQVEADLFDLLQKTSQELANRAFVQPLPGEAFKWQQELAALSKKYDELAAKLAELSPPFRQQHALVVADLQKALPAGTAFVDFLEYSHFAATEAGTRGPAQERRFVAFVVRASEFHVVELGPGQPIDKAVDAWRREIAGKGSIDKGEPPARVLARKVWQPLEKYVAGCDTVLVAPDGSLARMPFAALPGKKEGTYLIEDLALAVVPVPQLLPIVLGPRDPKAAAAPSLLLVGDVDYGAEAGAAPGDANRSAGLLTALGPWRMLPGTRGEVEAIGQAARLRYGADQVTTLAKTKATETAVRALAPKYCWLHFATHGFFAPPAMRSSVDVDEKSAMARPAEARDLAGLHPGLLSGIVLAGANRPADAARDDGILTALEVADLNLTGVELVVLSACETGLGELAGGEGVLGLQRAFQVAGARTVVATLWTIPDGATRDLMERFYGQLLSESSKMTRLEALRQAQLWMLRQGTSGPGAARHSITFDGEETPAVGSAAAPYYWAAFVLSGDVR